MSLVSREEVRFTPQVNVNLNTRKDIKYALTAGLRSKFENKA